MPALAQYREHPAPAALSGLALCAWSFTGPADQPLAHVVPPDGCTSLVRTPYGVLVVGPRTTPLYQDLPAGAHVDGVRLWPDAAPAVLGCSGAALRDQVALLAHLAPEAPFDWDASGIRCSPNGAALDPVVRAALQAIVAGSGQEPVGAVAAHVGVSVRTLERRFGDVVGLSPKAFARIRRFRHALAALADNRLPQWARAAADAGYADQAHLSREVRAFTGASPGEIGRYYASIDHAGVVP